MYLEIGDTTKENASKSDILNSIPIRAPSEDWHMLVARDNRNSLEAEGRADGRYAITHFTSDDIFELVEPQDGRDLKQLLGDYIDGNKNWRTGPHWKKFEPPAKGSSGGRLSALLPLLAAGGATLVFVAGPMLWGSLDIGDRLAAIPLPSAIDSTVGRILLGFFAACVLLFAVALVVKLVEVRRAARWPSTFGKVIRSQSRFEMKSPPGGGMPSNRRVADVAYEFTVNGTTHRGSRITLAEIVDENEVAPILARYPAGTVVKVHYDPADPSNSVLERDAPFSLGLGCLGMLAAGLAVVAGTMWLINNGVEPLQRALPNAFLPLTIMTGLGSIICLSIFVSARRDLAKASTWPKTTGSIVSSSTRSFTTTSSSNRTSRAWMPVVEYSYTVNGKSYNSRSVRYATEVGGSQAYAEEIAANYPVGKIVTVQYDPADPAQAALEFSTGLNWIVFAVGIGLGVAAVISSGVLKDWV